MKALFLIGFFVLANLNDTQAASYGQDCITHEEARAASQILPFSIPESELPELNPGWEWIKLYTVSRDPEEMVRWMSWPDGITLPFCN